MPDAAPQPPAPVPPGKPSPPPGGAPPPGPESATPKPAEPGALFRALVNAGADAMAAYTADQRMQTMTAETVAAQLQPFLVEMRQMRQMFTERFDQQDRKLDALSTRVDALSTRVDALTTRVDVLTTRVDGLKLLGQVILGALALLVTALIAVFGLLFTT